MYSISTVHFGGCYLLVVFEDVGICMIGTREYYYGELPAERERERRIGLMPVSLDQQCHGTVLCVRACMCSRHG